VIVLFAAQQWTADIVLMNIGKIEARKVFVPTGFSGLNSLSYSGYFEQMKSWLYSFDALVFLSKNYQDYKFAESCGAHQSLIIPNGASADEFLNQVGISIHEKFKIPAHHHIILHVGSHTSLKGHDEAMEIFEKSKVKNSTLLIVGNFIPTKYFKVKKIVRSAFEWIGEKSHCPYSCVLKPHKFNSQKERNNDGRRIIVTVLTRAETVAAYQQADLFLFPSNIECSPIVLFECMASKTPFLTSDVGNSVEIAASCGSGIILPTKIDQNGYSHVDIDQSAAIMTELLDNPEQRAHLAEQGWNVWKENYTWERIAETYERLYVDVCQTGGQ